MAKNWQRRLWMAPLLKLQIKIGVHLINVEVSQLLALLMAKQVHTSIRLYVIYDP